MKRLAMILSIIAISVLVIGLQYPPPAHAYPTGALRLYPSREDSTSLAFRRSGLLHSFEASGTELTAIRGVVLAGTAYGLTEFFSASRSSEVTPRGAVYFRAPTTGTRLFREVPGYKIFPQPGFYGSGGKIWWLSTRLNKQIECSIWLTALTTHLRYLSERPILRLPNWSCQVYQLLRISDGSIVMPVAYARAKDIYVGPWRVFVMRSKDGGRTWSRSTSQGYPGRGLLEPRPWLRKDGSVGIFCRTDRGHIALLRYYPLRGNWLSTARSTVFRGASAGASVRNLPNGRVGLTYDPGVSFQSNYPRRFVALAVTKDDFASLEAVHVIATRPSLSLPTTEELPYIHQPRLEVYRSKPIIYLEEVHSAAVISSRRYSMVAPLAVAGADIAAQNTPPAMRELAALSERW